MNLLNKVEEALNAPFDPGISLKAALVYFVIFLVVGVIVFDFLKVLMEGAQEYVG